VDADRFIAEQREHADGEHFRWQTRPSYFARTEAALVTGAVAGLRVGSRLLEMGCGEGGNLVHLAAVAPQTQLFGLDFSPAKARFAGRATSALTIAGDAARLPFADSVFDAVLIRDLLHHLPDRVRALREARRVLRSGGRLTLIEPNARSPLIVAQMAVVSAERRARVSTPARLRRELLEAGFRIVGEESLQPLPLARVVLHPRLGLASRSPRNVLEKLLSAGDVLAEQVVPRWAWTYLRFTAVNDDGMSRT
jgi:SAM-dependent methyltransferase